MSKLSQEKFAEILDTSLIYINQLEKGKRNTSLEMLDRISTSISKLLNIKVSSADLISYDEKKIITSRRIDDIKNKQLDIYQ